MRKKFICITLLVFVLAIGFGMSGPLSVKAQDSPELISLDYKDANLSTVLRSLSYSYDLNLVVTKDIKGKVTVSLRNVTMDEALKAILNVNGYAFTRKGNIVYITPGPGTEGIDLITKSINLDFITASEAERLLSKVISVKGDIQINETTNSLVVTDYESNIMKIREVLVDVDVKPIQVIIEAKIIDIQAKIFENFGTKIGVDYNPRGSGTGGGLFSRETNADESIDFDTSLAGPSSNLSGGQFTITTTLKDQTITTTIDALIRDQKAHLLASPSIATLNGKEARIIIGEKFPYTEKTQTTTGTTETTKFIDVGTTLKVTPLVSADGWITMNVHPEVSSVSAALDAGPRITTREADATVRVKDGETIIIGGLINKKEDKTDGGVPILRRIPILGYLFKHRSEDVEETELTVFITPRIISDTQTEVTKKSILKEEVNLSIDYVGELNLVAKLLSHANNLDKGLSAESANKSKNHRKEEMLNTYKLIVNQFPDSEKADFALYKMGDIYYYFKEYESAENAFNRLLTEYPKSRYKDKAKKYLDKTRKQLSSL